MPEHGQRRRRTYITRTRLSPQVFDAPNGEGVCVIPAKLTVPVCDRWCATCQFWRRLEGMELWAPGCRECRRPWE